jgi:hypothetical protein
MFMALKKRLPTFENSVRQTSSPPPISATLAGSTTPIFGIIPTTSPLIFQLRSTVRNTAAKKTRISILTLLAGMILAQSANGEPGPVVFLHYDYMVSTDPANPHSDAPNPETISRLVESFKRRGIVLVIDPQHAELPHYNFVGLGADGAFCAQVLSTQFSWLGWGGPSSTIEDLKAQYYKPKGNQPTHYAVFGHQAAFAGGPWEGCGRGTGIADLPGYDFLVGVGSFFHTPGHFAWLCNQQFGDYYGVKDYCLRLEAGTTMHELGHNLDLRHGGDEDENYKPNYLSVMNYLYQSSGIQFASVPGSTAFDHWELDYSDYAYPTLNEYHLDESVGLGGVPGDTHIATYATGCGDFNFVFTAPAATGAIDWNCDGVIERDVSVDLLGPFLGPSTPGLRLLTGFADWPHVQQFLNTPEYRSGQVRRGPKVP